MGPSSWEFKEGATLYKGPIDTAFKAVNGAGETLFLEGTSSDLKGDFYLELSGASLVAGSYTTPAVVFKYHSEGALFYSNDLQAAGKFTVVITKMDAQGVSGTFSGEVVDSSGGLKTITDGRFTAALATVAAPSNCVLSNLASYELSTGAKLNAITSSFNTQNQVIKTQLIDSSSQINGTVESEFNISYASGQVNVGPDQYFTLDGSGRISSFHGRSDPDSDTAVEVVIEYAYDGNGYMTGAQIFLAALPILPVMEYTYTWTGGDLTRVTIELVSGHKTVVDYEYDASQETKGFLSFHTNPELLLFQNAINYGKNSAHVPTKSTWTDYDTNNAVTDTYVSEFRNYVYDSNKYVQSFEITGDGSLYGSSINHVLSYRCF